LTERERRESRARGLGGEPLGDGSPLLGGAVTEAGNGQSGQFGAGDAAEEHGEGYDPRADDYAAPPQPAPFRANLPDLRALLPATDEERSLDDWGRSERFLGLVEPALNFYYRYWFRVETRGSRTSPRRAARCSSPTIRGRCLRTRRW
jgi:hypothetical protein